MEKTINAIVRYGKRVKFVASAEEAIAFANTLRSYNRDFASYERVITCNTRTQEKIHQFFSEGSVNETREFRTTGCGAWSITITLTDAATEDECNDRLAVADSARKAKESVRMEAWKADMQAERKGTYYVSVYVCGVRFPEMTSRRIERKLEAKVFASSKKDAFMKATANLDVLCIENGMSMECWPDMRGAHIEFLG